MLSRIFRRGVVMGALCSLGAYAQVCNSLFLYKDGSYSGKMEESTRSFPEAPEWSTNWGDFGEMKHPYIRLSGMRNYRGDWTGSLIFDALPVKATGGTLKLKARASQDANLGVWLSGNAGAGHIKFQDLKANVTSLIEIPIKDLAGSDEIQVEKVGVGLFNVPANQYTNFFIDDIELTCAQSMKNDASSLNSENQILVSDGIDKTPYVYASVNPSSPERNGLFDSENVRPASAHYDANARQKYQPLAKTNFLLTETEHRQILAFKDAQTLSAKKSREGWYKSLFLVERNRLQDNVIASPKRLYYEAGEIAAFSGYTMMPLLLADLDYTVSYCGDTLCKTQAMENYGLVLAGLPSSFVSGSQMRLVYDPYFVTTTRSSLPQVEACVNGKCQNLNRGSEILLNFESAGLQTIVLKIQSGNLTTQQKLFVEVK